MYINICIYSGQKMCIYIYIYIYIFTYQQRDLYDTVMMQLVEDL